MSKTATITNEKSKIMQYVKAVLIALMVSLVLILLFAFLIKAFDIGDKAILPVNIIIKLISIFIGVLIAIKNSKGGIKKGFIVGFFYIITSFLLFSILAKEWDFSIKILYDILFGTFAGAICGIICVNIKK